MMCTILIFKNYKSQENLFNNGFICIHKVLTTKFFMEKTYQIQFFRAPGEVDGVDVDVNVNNVNCCHYHSD